MNLILLAAAEYTSEAEMIDFRNLLMLGFSMVFGLIFAYLFVSYKKNRALNEEVDFLKKRVGELESPRESARVPESAAK